MSSPHTLTIKDETPMGEILHEMDLSFVIGEVSVKDIIAERVKFEVDIYNNKVRDHYYGLVQPTTAEKALNSFKFKNKSKVDVDKQIIVALKAFEENGFFLLVGDEQLDELSEKIDLSKNKSISFIKLTPLVGG